MRGRDGVEIPRSGRWRSQILSVTSGSGLRNRMNTAFGRFLKLRHYRVATVEKKNVALSQANMSAHARAIGATSISGVLRVTAWSQSCHRPYGRSDLSRKGGKKPSQMHFRCSFTTSSGW